MPLFCPEPWLGSPFQWEKHHKNVPKNCKGFFRKYQERVNQYVVICTLFPLMKQSTLRGESTNWDVELVAAPRVDAG